MLLTVTEFAVHDKTSVVHHHFGITLTVAYLLYNCCRQFTRKTNTSILRSLLLLKMSV